MKVIRDNKVYVQKNDIVYLNQTDLAIPASVYMKAISDGLYVNDSNRYDFIEFDEESALEFFNSLDFLIDYDHVKDLSDEEIKELGQRIMRERNNIAEKFNSMSEEDRERNSDMVQQCDFLNFKFYSLRDVLWFKQGHIKMSLPGESQSSVSPKKDNKVLRLVRDILKK